MLEYNKFAHVTKDVGDGITWLNLIKESGSPGFLLLLYDADQGMWFDIWFKTLSEGEDCAESQYGVNKNDWDTVEQLKIKGQGMPPI